MPLQEKQDYDGDFLNSVIQNSLIYDIQKNDNDAWDRLDKYMSNIKKETLSQYCSDDQNFFDRIDDYYQHLRIDNNDLYKINEKLESAGHWIPERFEKKIHDAKQEDKNLKEQVAKSLKRKRQHEVKNDEVPNHLKNAKCKLQNGYSSAIKQGSLQIRSYSFP